MTTEEILALLQGTSAQTDAITNGGGQQFSDMINTNKADIQPIVDRINGLQTGIRNTDAQYLDYAGNPSPEGMTIGERLQARESANMPARLEATKLGLNLGEKTLSANDALNYTNSDLSKKLLSAKNDIGGKTELGNMQGNKDELKSKLDNAAADRAADMSSKRAAAGGKELAARQKLAQDVVNYAIQEMDKGTFGDDDNAVATAAGIIKSYLPESTDAEISLLLEAPSGFGGSAQSYYDSIGGGLTEEQKRKKATGAINGLITGEW